ncbi:hypothetical protein EDD37DRAFT_634043, partial [Exophiala viscosa]|uniref:uncharacterized protein n=1 Tax=Exophiala viscosa TaxID=2486360 RepID=UPI002192A92F
MKRADLVPLLFQATVEASDGSEVSLLNLFRHFRETINIIWPFVGVPQVVPAAFGLAGYLQSRGFEELEDNRQRDDISKEDIQRGADTRTTIYQASANNEVFEMLTTYHGDFAYALNTVGFGYNLGRMPSKDFSLPEVELILTSALIALNATRQAGSHIKACIAFGYSEGDLRAVADAAEKFANWQGLKLSPIDIQQLHRQARAVMESL